MTGKKHISFRFAAICGLVLSLSVSFAAQAQTAARFLGSITAISGSTLTVKTDAGESRQVAVPDGASLKRIEPGQKDLNSAVTIALSDLAVGDRVLVRLDASSTATPPAAQQVIAIKAADVAQKQQKEREDWQKRGVAGLVKSVDAAGGVITITAGAGPTAKTVAVKTAGTTVLKRYAPGSVKFDDAQKAPMDAIHEGDQLRARGEKNADGTEIAAEEVVTGSFRNVSGLITSVDAGAATVSLKDLATKKQVTIHIGPDAQMHRIPDQMAQMLAARLKGGAAQAGGQRAAAPAAGAGGGQAQAGNGRAAGGGDPQQFLSRTPAIQIADLQKGQAVMVVATDGGTDVNAIMLVAGVEPLLEAPAASNLLSNWSMSSGGGGPE